MVLCAVFHGAFFSLRCLNVIKELCKLNEKEILLALSPTNYLTYVFHSKAILLTQFLACVLMCLLGDCSWKLAPQLNGMEVEYGTTSHIKEGRQHVWLMTCKLGLSCALYTIKSLENSSSFPVSYADSCGKSSKSKKTQTAHSHFSCCNTHRSRRLDLKMLSSENSPWYHLLVVLYNTPMPKLTFQFASQLVDSKLLPAWGNRTRANTLLLGCTHQCNKWYLIIPIHVYHRLFLSLANTESCRSDNFVLQTLEPHKMFLPGPQKD